jgi:hypothetical protein
LSIEAYSKRGEKRVFPTILVQKPLFLTVFASKKSQNFIKRRVTQTEKWTKWSLGKFLAQKHPLIFENIEEKKEK